MSLRLLLLIVIMFILAGCGGDSSQPNAGQVPSLVVATPDAPQTNQATPNAPPASATAQVIGCPDAPGPLNGPIVVSSDGNLASMQADGSAQTQLTTLPFSALAHDPTWSPDGQTLAYTLTQPTSDTAYPWLQVGMICGLDRATGKGRLLARGAEINDSLSEAAWTPDGKALMVGVLAPQFDNQNNYTSNKFSLGRYDLATSTLQALIDNATSPAMSPDGQRLALLQVDPTTFKATLAVAQADGSDLQPLAATQQFVSLADPRWSPDGKQIAFTAAGTVTGSGSGAPKRSLLEIVLGIAVAEAHGTPADVWVADAATLALQQITQKLLDDPRVAWGPDGRMLYTDNGMTTGTSGVMLLDPATGQAQQIAQQKNYLGIDWTGR